MDEDKVKEVPVTKKEEVTPFDTNLKVQDCADELSKQQEEQLKDKKDGATLLRESLKKSKPIWRIPYKGFSSLRKKIKGLNGEFTPSWLYKPKRKVERNSSCPCGSGLKYKKCCLFKDDPYYSK